jgi:hypothetical protein
MESCVWRDDAKACGIDDAKKQELMASIAHMFEFGERSCGYVEWVVRLKALKEVCEQGNENGKCPEEVRGNLGECGLSEKWKAKGKRGDTCMLVEECAPAGTPETGCKAIEQCQREAQRAVNSSSIERESRLTEIKHRAWLECLRGHGCTDIAEYENKQWLTSQTCSKLVWNDCRKNQHCKLITWQHAGSQCEHDPVSIFHSMAPDKCGLKPLFKLQLKCKRFMKTECGGQCSWEERHECEPDSDSGGGEPIVGTVGVCSPRPAAWMSEYAKMTENLEMSALAQLVEAEENCSKLTNKHACQGDGFKGDRGSTDEESSVKKKSSIATTATILPEIISDLNLAQLIVPFCGVAIVIALAFYCYSQRPTDLQSWWPDGL